MITRYLIKKAPKGGFRTELHIEDVNVPYEGFAEFSLLQRASYEGEEYIIMKDAYNHPNFYKYRLYPHKIQNGMDKDLQYVILDLLYLNPHVDTQGKSKMATYIVNNFVDTYETQSEMTGNAIQLPLLDHADVLSTINAIDMTGLADQHQPLGTKLTLYKTHSTIPSTIRMTISKDCRMRMTHKKIDEIATQVVEELGESPVLLKITHSRIEEVTQHSEMPISKYLSKKTESPYRKELTADYNRTKPFKTEVAFQKFKQFVQLQRDSASNAQIIKKLKISKSTLMEYKKIYKNLNSNKQQN